MQCWGPPRGHETGAYFKFSQTKIHKTYLIRTLFGYTKCYHIELKLILGGENGGKM